MEVKRGITTERRHGAIETAEKATQSVWTMGVH